MTRTGLRPRATRGTDGLNWANALADPTRAAKPAQPSSFEDIHWFNPDDPFLLPTTGPKVLNTPSLATDPNDQGTIYMAFMGLTQSANNFENIDLMIAKSADGGANFSGIVNDGDQVLHLTDADLGDPDGSVQFLPTVAVDGYGGVNIVYYVGWRETGSAFWIYQVKYARVGQFGTNPHPGVRYQDLTPAFEMGSATVRHLDPGPHEFFGDYIQSDIRKCNMWVAFPARPAGRYCQELWMTV